MENAEESLVNRAREGDLTAFNELVLAHQVQAYSLCLRMLGSAAAAEDATQDAFVSAWRGIRGLRGQGFRPWLMRIAANVCTDELRRRARRPAASLETALEAGVPDPPDPEAGPEQSAISGEVRARIDAALQALPPDQRLVVVLCDVQDLDYAEAAQVMATSIGTVKSRLSRARTRLRAILLAEPELLPAQFRPKYEGPE